MNIEKVDGLELVRSNPKMFLNFEQATGEILCSKIVRDALTSGTYPIVVDRQDNWWLVSAQRNWIRQKPNDVSISDLFIRIHPNPRSGVNSMRNEILLSTFADQIVLFKVDESSKKQDSPKTGDAGYKYHVPYCKKP